MTFKKATEQTKVLGHLHIQFYFGSDSCTYRLSCNYENLHFICAFKVFDKTQLLQFRHYISIYLWIYGFN